jgi:hypothetical protein
MTPKAQPKSAPFTPVVLDTIADTLLAEYEGRFRPVYEDTVQALGRQRPQEPADEIRNAFDHFSIATKHAFAIDQRPAPIVLSHKGVADPHAATYTNLAQAQRHLVLGRFHCIEHQIEALIKEIHARVNAMTDKDRASEPIKRIMADTDRLHRAYRKLRKLRVKPLFDPKKIARDLKTREVQIERLTQLVNGFLTILRDVPRRQNKSR